MLNADLKKWIIETIGVGNAKNAAYYRPKWLERHHPDSLKKIVDATHFLGQDVSISARVACIIGDITSTPLCEHCKTNRASFQNGKFGRYCSIKCQSNSPLRQERRRATNLKKYGVEHNQRSEVVKLKREQTCLERYGNIHPTKTAKVKELLSKKSKAAHAKVDREEYDRRLEKAKNTNLQKRGVEFSLQDPTVRDKGKNTLLDRYGVDNAAKSEQVMDKIKETNQQRYGTSWGLSNKEVREKITETFKHRHGVEHPSQIPEVRRRAEETTFQRLGVRFAAQSKEIQERTQKKMLEKYGVRWTTQAHITPDSLARLNDPVWLRAANKTKSLHEISTELKVYALTVRNYFRKHGIELTHHFRSSGEDSVASFLKEIGITDFQRNIRGVIGRAELDIYIPDKQIAIEYHGVYWHSENVSRRNRTRHFKLWRKCEERNIRLYQIYEHEWLHPQKNLIWRSILAESFGIGDLIYAEQCEVVELDSNSAKEFFDENHLQGYFKANIHLGLIHNNQLASVMSLWRGNNTSEIVRYCSACDLRVIGGASRLLAFFCENWTFNQIIAPSDNRYSNQMDYEELGFQAENIIRPQYVYVHNSSYEEKSISDFRNNNLRRSIKDYDAALSLYENLQRSNWLRLWDAGKVRWVMRA